MKRILVIAVVCCIAFGTVWAKHSPAHSQQKAAAHAVKAQQKAGARAMSAAHHPDPYPRHGGYHGGAWHGSHAAPPPVFRRGVPPPNMHGWRRGPAPHPHYRSGWYGDVWYDAYGYPYYGPAVVTPAPVVAPAPVVVRPAPVVVTPAPAVVTPAPVVVQPAPVVAPPPPPPPPPRPAAVVPVRQVVY